MSRKLFCQISPFTYQISVKRLQWKRHLSDFFKGNHFAMQKNDELLPFTVYSHNSLIRRKLGNVNMELQDNKAVNLALAAPKINMLLIRPKETFSFWKLVGKTDAKKGYRDGVQIAGNRVTSGIGGGMCQFTNLLHWMVLHTPLTITEHHHHDRYDLFPDYNRQVPFGTGTSIFYNYLDYRFYNGTDITFQLITYTTEEYLCGEIRSDKPLPYSYHIKAWEDHFEVENGTTYRCGKVYRRIVDKSTGNTLQTELLRTNHAQVMYELPANSIMNK